MYLQKLEEVPPRGVLRKTCSEKMQQIYMRMTMQSVLQSNFVHTSGCVFSCKFTAYFQNIFSK